MILMNVHLKPVVAAIYLCVAAGSALAQDGADPLDDLFAALRMAGPADAARISDKIVQQWSRSGSVSMDLLLDRGREAMDADDPELALGHFSALVDHAPDFAEAYNARATAYYQLGRFGQALADLEVALALNPRHFGALTGVALMLEELGHDAAALRAWREVAQISPAQDGLDEAIARLSVRVEGVTL